MAIELIPANKRTFRESALSQSKPSKRAPPSRRGEAASALKAEGRRDAVGDRVKAGVRDASMAA
jgi:hypothetical protein